MKIKKKIIPEMFTETFIDYFTHHNYNTGMKPQIVQLRVEKYVTK